MGVEMTKELDKFLKKLEILAEKLDILTRVTAISIQKEKFFKDKTQKEQIEFLANIGLDRNLIALIVGTTPLTVSVTLSKMKKKQKRRETKSNE